MNLDAKNDSTPVTSHPNPLSDLPDEVDALVIGGGIAGLSAAWQLARMGSSHCWWRRAAIWAD